MEIGDYTPCHYYYYYMFLKSNTLSRMVASLPFHWLCKGQTHSPVWWAVWWASESQGSWQRPWPVWLDVGALWCVGLLTADNSLLGAGNGDHLYFAYKEAETWGVYGLSYGGVRL